MWTLGLGHPVLQMVEAQDMEVQSAGEMAVLPGNGVCNLSVHEELLIFAQRN